LNPGGGAIFLPVEKRWQNRYFSVQPLIRTAVCGLLPECGPAHCFNRSTQEYNMAKLKTIHGIEEHKVVFPGDWLRARKRLLKEEKKFSKSRDKLNRQRRELPWVRVDKEYVFDTSRGSRTLAELFDGKSQLIVYHFMFGPGWKEGCPHCSFWADITTE
jgi:hypothetical protein